MKSGRGGGTIRGGSERAQSSVIGVALIMGIVVIGTTSVIVLGGMALEDTQTQSELGRAEQILTLFDSRMAMVALGDSDVQTIRLAHGGTYTVDKTAGQIRLVHDEYNGSGTSETIYDASMGTMVFERGTTKFAYQGGGVWRKDRDGDARMITPPEFHYRDSTLTFPFVRLASNASGSGGVTATVRANKRAVPIYPNSSASPDGSAETGAPYDPVSGLEEPYENPVENGTLTVFVTSEYYEGWAYYFRERTEANVTTFDSNETVKAELVSLGTQGFFEMPDEGNGLTIRGLEGDHTLNSFQINITDADTEADFNNLRWSMHAGEGQQKQLELGVRKQGGGDPCGDPVMVSLYFTPDGGTTQHTWQNDSAYTVGCGDVDGDGTEDAYVEINFTSETVNLTYESDGNFDNSGLYYYDNDYQQPAVPDTITWDEHDGSVSYEPLTINNDDERAMDHVVNHYFALMGEEFELVVGDQQGGGNSDGGVAEGDSSGFIDYPGSGKYIAYLHVTENEVSVSFT